MSKHFKLEFSEEIGISDNISLRQKRSGFKKFAKEIIQGWFPNIITKDSRHGVQKIRIIDKINNFYKEFVKDLKSKKIIRNVEEKLTDHKNNHA